MHECGDMHELLSCMSPLAMLSSDGWCYGLNVCVQNSYGEILTVREKVVGDGALGR